MNDQTRRSDQDHLDQMQAENIALMMRDGPRLRTGYHHWAVAVDLERGKVLLGGLGAMGVGQMWSEFRDWVNGLHTAPHIDSGEGGGFFNCGNGDAAALERYIAAANEDRLVVVRCVTDEDEDKEQRCGTAGPYPADDVPGVCPYCHGPLEVIGRFDLR